MEETATLDCNQNGSTYTKAMVFKLYKKRWFIIFLYCIYTIISYMHFIEYAVIADVVVKYYSVSYASVDSVSAIFLILYIPFCLPGSFILDKLGLRLAVLIGATLISVGAWIKVFSVEPSRFWVLMLGQIIISICQVLVLPLPPKVAAVWFGPKEVSLACTIGVASAQAAAAVGFILPPLLVQSNNLINIQQSLQRLSYVFAIPTTLLIPILYFCFDDAPSTPPSKAQFRMEEIQKVKFDYLKSLKNLVTNKSFMILVIISGINIGVACAQGIILNQLILFYHPNASVDVGVIGLLMMGTGILGTLSIGFLITNTKKLKEVTWFCFVSTFLTMAAFLFLLNQKLYVTYITALIYNFIFNATYCLSVDLAVELTYPEPIGASSGLVTISFQLFGIIITYLYSHLLFNFNIFKANLCIVLIVLLADSLLICLKFNFKRQSANDEEITAEVPVSDFKTFPVT